MNRYKIIAEKLQKADAVLIGASNGFSISEGLHIFADNQAFEELSGDFKKAYGIRSILGGMLCKISLRRSRVGLYKQACKPLQRGL